MIDRATGNEFIDQAFFSFNHDGLTIVASSLPSHDEGRWQARLRQHVRLQRHSNISRSPYALSYFRFSSDIAAVLRRVNHGDSTGRNYSHVLMGSAQVLTADVALRLESWPGWQDEPPSGRKMSRLPTGELRAEPNLAVTLRAKAQRKQADLERVVGRLLEAPDRPLSIIGCPDEDRLALLWGLMEVSTPVLKARGVHRTWTFSTYQSDHSDAIPELLETVYLPARPVRATARPRTTVDLSRDEQAGPAAAAQARQLVARYVNDQPEPSPLNPAPHVPALSSPPDFVQLVRSLLTARDSAEFENRLATLEHHDTSQSDREAIRNQLKIENYGIARLTSILPSADLDLAFSRLIVVAFGRWLTDFTRPAALENARKIIEISPSDELAHVLIQLATNYGYHSQITSSVRRRRDRLADTAEPYLNEMDPPQHTHFTGTTERSWPIPKLSPKGQKNLLAAGALALSVLFFVLGLVMGISSSPDVTPSASETQEPSPGNQFTARVAGMARNPDGKLEIKGTLDAGLASGEQLWLLFEQAEPAMLFPQLTPCEISDNTNWSCRQEYLTPGDGSTRYDVVLVRTDKLASEFFANYATDQMALKDAPVTGIVALPSGATRAEIVLQ